MSGRRFRRHTNGYPCNCCWDEFDQVADMRWARPDRRIVWGGPLQVCSECEGHDQFGGCPRMERESPKLAAFLAARAAGWQS